MRLLTRSDFDGICCAVLLKELGLMDEMVYAHPKDLQDGKISVTSNDILANVPYVPGCGLWFDHHSSEQERLRLNGRFEGRSARAPSAARVIYDYYGPEKLGRYEEMLTYVDKLTRTPAEMVPADVEGLRASGFDDDGISEIAMITGLFGYYNRIADGLGIDSEENW